LLYQFFFCPIRDRDCVAHRPSTSRLYLDVGIDFTGLFFLSDPAAWRDGRHPRGRSFAPPPTSPPRPHVDLRRLVVAFTDRDAFTDFAHRRLASRYSV
jgi:hypothetical protein